MSQPVQRLRASLQSLAPYEAGKPIEELQRELGLSRVVKLASNEYPEPPFPEVLAAIEDELRHLHRYPDPSQHALHETVASVLGVAPSEVFFGNGANEILELLVHTVIDGRGGPQIVYAHPSFPIYGILCQSHFESGRAVPLDSNSVHDLDAMARAIEERTRCVLLCNPNNPTATYFSQAALHAFLRRVPPDVVVVLDEAYVEFVTAEDFPDFFALRREFPNLFSLRSFSKIYSLAGLRLGVLIGDADFLSMMQRVRQPFHVNRLVQRAACVAIQQQHRVAERRATNRRRLMRLVEGLGELGLQVLPSQTNFLLATRPGAPASFFQELLREGVIVRPMGSFGLPPGSFRVNVGTEEENEFFLSALRRVLLAADRV